MAIRIKSPREIGRMREAGLAASGALMAALRAAAPGITTAELDAMVGDELARRGAVSAARGYRSGSSPPFPGESCICLNEEVVHGLPGARIVRDGDMLSIDVACRLGGWCADAAASRIVGASTPDLDGLLAAADGVVGECIAAIAPGRRWSDVAEAARRAAASFGCILVSGYCGHGIGRGLHEPPRAPLWPTPPPDRDFVLRPGMVLTVEPIVVRMDPARPGGPELLGLSDGWTVVSRDRSTSCHQEVTVAVALAGAEVLTPHFRAGSAGGGGGCDVQGSAAGARLAG